MLFVTTAIVLGQHVGHETPEFHPPMPIKKCTKSGGCVTEQTKAVLDSNWRWTHKVGNTTNCFSGNKWDPTLCDDVASCTANCAIDGVSQKDLADTYGVTTDGQGAINISFVTKGQYSRNVGSRFYLLEDDDSYKMFDLVNKEVRARRGSEAPSCPDRRGRC